MRCRTLVAPTPARRRQLVFPVQCGRFRERDWHLILWIGCERMYTAERDCVLHVAVAASRVPCDEWNHSLHSRPSGAIHADWSTFKVCIIRQRGKCIAWFFFWPWEMHFVEPGAHLISFPHRGEPMGTVGEKKGVLNLLRLISSRGCTISNWPDSDIFLSRCIVYWKTYKYMAPNDFIYFLKNLFILCNHLAKQNWVNSAKNVFFFFNEVLRLFWITWPEHCTLISPYTV